MLSWAPINRDAHAYFVRRARRCRITCSSSSGDGPTEGRDRQYRVRRAGSSTRSARPARRCAQHTDEARIPLTTRETKPELVVVGSWVLRGRVDPLLRGQTLAEGEQGWHVDLFGSSF